MIPESADGAVTATGASIDEPDVPPQVYVAPGRSSLGPAVAAFDRWADLALERLRGTLSPLFA